MAAMIPFTEFARRVCEANHDYRDGPKPCGKHINEATNIYGLTKPEGRRTLGVVMTVVTGHPDGRLV